MRDQDEMQRMGQLWQRAWESLSNGNGISAGDTPAALRAIILKLAGRRGLQATTGPRTSGD